jgi:hypothetical protein
MMQLVLLVLTKKKRNDPLPQIIWVRWQKISTNISIILMKVSVPIENG